MYPFRDRLLAPLLALALSLAQPAGAEDAGHLSRALAAAAMRLPSAVVHSSDNFMSNAWDAAHSTASAAVSPTIPPAVASSADAASTKTRVRMVIPF